MDNKKKDELLRYLEQLVIKQDVTIVTHSVIQDAFPGAKLSEQEKEELLNFAVSATSVKGYAVQGVISTSMGPMVTITKIQGGAG